ncbi:hypothetical protein Celaphus_00007845 [Cervus elaphus hippelaphus]|uniref:Uncharacterized protein n=1 Tax=Cervus elaphus hippelaphus TaxID=46360 RepID=A0A212CBB5_CEREH|nr:hypothetical protein Celaphus_00007845 [Cervus elaphus hippelaphus]
MPRQSKRCSGPRVSSGEQTQQEERQSLHGAHALILWDIGRTYALGTGYVKLLFLAIAVLVVLDQASPGNQTMKRKETGPMVVEENAGTTQGTAGKNVLLMK